MHLVFALLLTLFGQSADQGTSLDPDGLRVHANAGVIIDPNGYTALAGSSMDPNGTNRGPGIDPDGRGFSIDPNG